MGCDYPLKGYRRPHAAGDTRLTFNPLKALNSTNPMLVPCGQCMGCRLEKSRQWAMRCTHEAQLYEHNCFITLTFDDEHLPPGYSVRVRDMQLFIKRLRKSLRHQIRFFYSGEYGDESSRPHYHALIFNHDFYPKTLWSRNERGEPIYTSPSLSKLWSFGRATTAALTFESAAYVARYTTKKINGDATRVIWFDNAWHAVEPEFGKMSRRPGLGAPWLERFRSDVYPSDQVVIRGQVMNPPRYYDSKLTEEELEMLKRRRKAAGLRYKSERTPARRRAREIVRDARISTLKRKL